jgi:hypothetical protein
VHLEPSRELEALDTFVNNIIKKRWCNLKSSVRYCSLVYCNRTGYFYIVKDTWAYKRNNKTPS